jgi:hypothetical protein
MSNEGKSKLTTKLKRGGQKIKHGGYSFLVKGELPENRKHVLKYLTAARQNLIKDLGPTEDDLTAAQIIIIDRIISKLGVVRCIEEYIRENTVMTGARLSPSLRESYLAYNNSIRLDLQALGIDKRKADDVLTPWQLARKVEEEDRERREKEGKDG